MWLLVGGAATGSLAHADGPALADRGIYAELGAQVEAALAATPASGGDALHIDDARGIATLYDKVDTNINHRRVKTIRVWFDRDFQPGDVVFFDTFPQKSGAEHVGLVSDRAGPDGKLLIVNNWTDGAVDAEMPLLSWVPVTDHFRAPGNRHSTTR